MVWSTRKQFVELKKVSVNEGSRKAAAGVVWLNKAPACGCKRGKGGAYSCRG